MIKSGLILGGVMLILAGLVGVINFQACGPCLALFAGVGAGFLAGVFERPLLNEKALRAGAGAGAIGGIGALVGHLVGGIVGALLLGPEQAMEMMRQLGAEVEYGSGTAVGFYAGASILSCCLGLFEIALMAGLGAAGGALWFQIMGKNQTTTPPAPTF